MKLHNLQLSNLIMHVFIFHVLYSYPDYDNIPEVYLDDYQYGNSASFVDVSDDTLFSPLYYDQYRSVYIEKLFFYCFQVFKNLLNKLPFPFLR